MKDIKMTDPTEIKTYSNSDLAKALNVSKSTVKTYRALVKKAFALAPDRVQAGNGSLTQDGLVQMQLVAEFANRRKINEYVKAVYQANPELEPKPENLPNNSDTALDTPGQITLHQGASVQAQPLIKFEIKPVELSLEPLDTSALDAQTAQYQQTSNDAVNLIAAALNQRFSNGVSQIVAEQDNLLQGLKAQTIGNAASAVAQASQQPGKSTTQEPEKPHSV